MVEAILLIQLQVLLYDFFSDSTMSISQWRVVLNKLPGDFGLKCPTFDEEKHRGICHEVRIAAYSCGVSSFLDVLPCQLKSLYVAMTRARTNLWIVDYSTKSESMKVCILSAY